MSNRIYGTEKVNDVIGLNKNQKYDKIDIFTERTNYDNSLAIVYRNEIKKGKPYLNKEVIVFPSHSALMKFIEENFDTYELEYYVPQEIKQIFFHFVDFRKVDYYLHDGKPDKNYVVLDYREYANGTFYPKTLKLPKEYEDLLLGVVNRSKKMVGNMPVSANTVDVNEQRKINYRENYRRYTEPMSEIIRTSGEKLKNIKSDKKTVHKLKIVMAGALLTSLLAGGYKLMTDNLFNSTFLEQTNPLKNAKDLSIYSGKGNAGVIIEKLMLGKYEEVTLDELKFVLEFINTIDSSNYDKNGSFNEYSYEDYFDYMLLGRENYTDSRKLLTNLEDLYRKSFVIHDDGVFIDKEAANKYIDYVLSLTFMYDTYHSDRPFTTVKLNTQAVYNSRATDSEAKVFDSYPEILKIIILNQLKGLIQHSYYEVKNEPSYYFKATDRNSLIEEIRNKIGELEDILYLNCGRNYKGM